MWMTFGSNESALHEIQPAHYLTLLPGVAYKIVRIDTFGLCFTVDSKRVLIAA